MKNLTSEEEIIKHIQHITNTQVDIKEPLKIYKTDYKIEIYYLGNLIYLLDTTTLDKKIEDILRGEE